MFQFHHREFGGQNLAKLFSRECWLLLLLEPKSLLQPEGLGLVQEFLDHLPYLLIVPRLNIPAATPLLPHNFRENLPLTTAHFPRPSSLPFWHQFMVYWECSLKISLPLERQALSPKVCSMQNVTALKQQASSKLLFSHNARNRHQSD